MQRPSPKIRTRRLPPGYCAALVGALALLVLSGCGKGYWVPFVPASHPPSEGPAPQYPSLIPPPRNAETAPLILTEDQRKAKEEELKRLAVTPNPAPVAAKQRKASAPRDKNRHRRRDSKKGPAVSK